VLALARALAGRALVVVDEAYVEFADTPSLVPYIAAQPNLAVLRTLSKAHALAAARIGCVIADADVIAVLRRCQAPYPVPVPSAQRALRALAATSLRQTRERVARTREQRARMHEAIADLPGVRRVYPSQTNFLLLRLDDPGFAFERLLDAGVVVRDMRAMPQLGDALRISLGTPAQNDRLLSALTVPALEASS
jgi:histidinol-phosphate aminotransferase